MYQISYISLWASLRDGVQVTGECKANLGSSYVLGTLVVHYGANVLVASGVKNEVENAGQSEESARPCCQTADDCGCLLYPLAELLGTTQPLFQGYMTC